MAAKHKSKRPQIIRCEFCGEDYADSYKQCPFCDERIPDDSENYDYETFGDEALTDSAGKRLVTNRRGGGYGGAPSPLKIIGTIISLAVIVAAVIIVITIVKPLVDKGQTTLPGTSPTPAITATPGQTEPTPLPPTDTTSPADPTEAPAATPSPAVTPAPTPAGQTATSFTLDKSDFSMSNQYGDPVRLKVTFQPAGSTGTITWSSSNADIATVDSTGKISHGTKNGQATITATMGGITQTCIVRCNFTGATTSTTGGTQPPAQAITGLALNKSDFTFNAQSNPAVQMRVTGSTATPSWSIADTSVATISSGGVVTPVGKGLTTITCTVDGQTLKCIVRCNF